MLSTRYKLASSEVKESLLLLAFAFLLREHLTVATLCFVIFGSILVIIKRRPGKILRNVVALGIFGSYWWSYGKVIDPEVGLNFLTSVIVLKIMEKETLRDRFMVFFGLLLVISAGSLFEKTLSYVFFFGLSFFVLIQDFYQSIGARWRVGELFKALVWVLPLTLFLFFLVPRAMSPLPFQQGSPGPGEIGYTSSVNISQVESLTGNNSPVFEVSVSKKLSQDQLYWRGNAITFTDGWNWLVLNKAYPSVVAEEKDLKPTPDEVFQKFRMVTREDYYFSLDHPKKIFAKERVFLLDKTKSFPQGKSEWSPRYQVISSAQDSFTADDDESAFTRIPLKPAQRKWIQETFPADTVDGVLEQVRGYFVKNAFSYSLAPGRIQSFQEFMLEKKTGFCSHYASALGLILRVKKIPARLVSGFMGGAYNPYADYYEVSQNDAHVWVEVLRDGRWVRVDPTGWMAPSRLSLGGEAYMGAETGARGLNFLAQFGWYYNAKMWLGQWDYLFYQWLEEMDYQFQEKWITKFKLKRHWLYSFAILSLAFFMLLYAWSLKRAANRGKTSFDQQLWQIFLDKTESRGLSLSPVSLHESREQLVGLSHKDQEKLLRLWDQLVSYSFGKSDEPLGKEIFAELRRL